MTRKMVKMVGLVLSNWVVISVSIYFLLLLSLSVLFSVSIASAPGVSVVIYLER